MVVFAFPLNKIKDATKIKLYKRTRLVRVVQRCAILCRKHPVRSILLLVFSWSLVTTLIQVILIVWNKPSKSYFYSSEFSILPRKLDAQFVTYKRITLLYTYHDFNAHPVETDIKQHPKVIWIEQELFEPDNQSSEDSHHRNALYDLRNCTNRGLDTIANSLSLTSWLKWKKHCAFNTKTENGCYSYLKNMCQGSYLVIKATSQVTLQYILRNLDLPGLHILHLVPTESSLPESLFSYWGKLHKLISLPFREINAKVDFCSHIKADINYVESNLSLSLDDKYMLLNVEDYKSNPRWYMMELLNFLDLYPSDYHLQQIHNTPTYQQETSKASSVPVRTLLQVNLGGLQALKTLKGSSNC